MRSKIIKTLSFCLIALMLLPMALVSISAENGDVYDPTSRETEPLGYTFDSKTTAKMEKVLPSLPYTYEAEIQINTTNRGGVILGNYGKSGGCISFEIYNNGNPRLYIDNGNKATSVVFDKVSVISTEILKLSITVDEANNMANCYINGELKQSLSFNYSVISNTIPTENPLMIGGDYRSGNERYFLGQIKSVYAYSDMRTADEIKSGANLGDENLLVGYEFMTSGAKNLSKHQGYDLITEGWKMDVLEENALTFSPNNTYQVMKAFSKPILTYEAEIYFPISNDNSSRGGVILGNYRNKNCVNFEFKERGTPRLYFEINGTAYDFHFTSVDVRLGKFVFVTITFDTITGDCKCYVDGELKQTINKGVINIPDDTYANPMRLGSDTRGSGGYPFKGAIKSLAVYSDVRTADEISADMNALDKEADNLLAMYQFNTETGRSDISGNCYHICYNGEARPEDTSVPEAPTDPDVPTDPDTPTEPEAPAEIDGLTFESSDYAIVGKKFPIDSNALTFEAVIQLSKSVSGRGGIILGNYKDTNHFLNFEIVANGAPRLCITSYGSVNTRHDYQFTTVDVRGDAPVHLAITLNKETGVAVCYVNGQEKQTIYKSTSIDINPSLNDYYMVIGNDLRTRDNQCFKGVIGSVAVYTDLRTANEIKLDANGINAENDNLEMYFNLSGLKKGDDICDLTGNGYDAKFGSRALAEKGNWIKDKEEVTDYLYSFAVVGDTQIIASSHGSKFGMIYDWILANQQSKKIGYVFGLGDITNNNSGGEWALAKEHILNKLTGVIPYSVVRGNHDGLANINSLFATEAYMSQFDGFYEKNNVTNSYRFFEIADTEYLLFTLDYGANDSVLNWAGEIIKANPDKKVIITTHAYLYRDGTTLDQGDVCPPATTGGSNNGDHMWDKLISKYENIFLVMSGHDPHANVVVTQTEGVNGNIVTQILSDHQGVDTSTPTGMVTMLYFKADGSIEVETYSTIQEAYYKEENQFVIEETEHSYVKNPIYNYENSYLQNGVLSVECAHCDKKIERELSPIIVFKGYSVKDNNSAMCVDYSINYKLLDEYKEATGKEIVLGVVSCASDNLVNGDNKPINADGTSADVISGKIVSSVIETKSTNVSVIMRTSDWTKYMDKNIIMCMYIIENGTVNYVCQKNTVTNTALSVTYNGISKGGSEE